MFGSGAILCVWHGEHGFGVEMALDFLTVSFASWAVVLGALMSHTLRIILRTVFLRPWQQAQDKS